MDNDGKMEKLTVPALRPLTLLCIISMHFNAFYQFLLVAPVHFCIRGSERCMCRCGHRTMAFSGLLGGDFPRKLCIDGIAARPYREESSSCTASWVLGVLWILCHWEIPKLFCRGQTAEMKAAARTAAGRRVAEISHWLTARRCELLGRSLCVCV